jgi:hypothetical protein
MNCLGIRFALLFLALAFTACQSTSTTDDPPAGDTGTVEVIPLQDGSKLYFPRQPASGGDQMETLLEGNFTLDNGCLRIVTSGYEAPGFLILWPSAAVPQDSEDGILELFDESGEVIGRVGEPIRMGGGAMEDDSSMAFWEEQIDGLPIEGCPGPYWLAGALYPLAGSDATATTQPLATPYAQEPASGICAEFEGSLVSVSLRPDVPDPRCVRVRADQHLSIKNDTDQYLQVSIGGFQAELAPGQEIAFETPFGEYLAPGVHQLTTSATPGGSEIWLVGEQP